MAPRKSALFDTATTLGKIMSFLGISALCGLLAAGLIFPLAATGGAAASAGNDILDEIPAELQEEPLSTPSYIYANDNETLLATFYRENRTPVELDDIAQTMQDAIIAIEDERFYEHGGVDGQGVARAAVHNAMNPTTQGASTLTMQYVNNVLNNAAVVRGEDENLLAAGIQEKTYADKLREMKLSVQVEQEMTKDEILEGYLNIVMLGGRNYGVEAASQYYWGVSASELNLQQSATLAGIVQAPNTNRPDTNPENARDRRDTVLRSMHTNGFISEQERDEAIASNLDLVDNPQHTDGCVEAELGNYFCDYITEEFLMDEQFGEDIEERAEFLARGGLRIVTTLDPELQREAEDTVDQHQPGGQGAAAVINTMDNENGNILAMAQSTHYDPNEESEDWNATSLNLNAGGLHNGGIGYPGGSIIKPFVAAAWIEEGGSMDDMVDGSERDYDYGEEWEASCAPGGTTTLLGDDDEWRITNVRDEGYHRQSIDWGLFWSYNTATLATAYDMDLCAITDVTDRVGIEGYTGGASAEDYGGLSVETPAFIMGSTTVTPLTMNAAYSSLGSDGVRCEPRVFESITGPEGEEYEVREPDCEEVLDPDVVAQLNDTLINIPEWSQYSLDETDGNPPFPMAGKTGTHEQTNAMSFIGYTEGISTAAYIARIDDNGDMWELGNVADGEFASSVSLPLWWDYMTEIGGNYATGDFREADDSPFSDRREWRYGDDAAGAGGGGGGGSSDDDDDDNGDDDDDDDDND